MSSDKIMDRIDWACIIWLSIINSLVNNKHKWKSYNMIAHDH